MAINTIVRVHYNMDEQILELRSPIYNELGITIPTNMSCDVETGEKLSKEDVIDFFRRIQTGMISAHNANDSVEISEWYGNEVDKKNQQLKNKTYVPITDIEKALNEMYEDRIIEIAEEIKTNRKTKGVIQ